MGLIERLSEIDGPKTLVLVSEGLVAEPQLVDMTALGAAAQAARVTIYVLQLEIPILDASERTASPTLQADLQAREDGLVRLAGTARGALFHLVGADSHPFNRISGNSQATTWWRLKPHRRIVMDARIASRCRRMYPARPSAQAGLSWHHHAIESGYR